MTTTHTHQPEILSTLDSLQSSRSRRRFLLFAVLILIGYLSITSFFSFISLTSSILITDPPLNSSRSPSQSEQLLKLLSQRRSSYPSHRHSLLPISAIISLRNSHQPRIDDLLLILRFLANYPFINEIIIWNDDVITTQFNLNVEDLISRLHPTLHGSHLPVLRVINSPGGMKEMSSHMACSLAKYATCYHSDENILNLNLDTLYTKYLESDSESEASIVDRASPQEYSAETRYDVFQPDHSLHSGLVSQLSRGSLAAKSLSTRYFQQLTTTTLVSNHATTNPSSSSSFKMIPPSVSSDIQFSIWSNRRPLKLITPPQSLVHINPPVDPLKHLDSEFIHRTYERLNETIRSSDPFLVPALFPRASSSSSSSALDPRRDSEIGVASAFDDRSMLITSLAFSPDWPLAVDGELSTCWRDSSALKPGSFLGLNFVKPTLLNRLIIFGSLEVAEEWGLEVVYSTHPNQWNATLVVPRISTHQEPPVTKYVFDLSTNQPTFGGSMVKKVRLLLRPKIAAAPLREPNPKEDGGVSLCGWMINEDWVL